MKRDSLNAPIVGDPMGVECPVMYCKSPSGRCCCDRHGTNINGSHLARRVRATREIKAKIEAGRTRPTTEEVNDGE